MTGIRRAGTYPCSIRPPRPPADYSAIRVTFTQNQNLIISKTLGNTGLTINGDRLEITLTQQETMLFMPSMPSPMGARTGAPAVMQAHFYLNDFDAPISPAWVIPVYDSNGQGVLPDG